MQMMRVLARFAKFFSLSLLLGLSGIASAQSTPVLSLSFSHFPPYAIKGGIEIAAPKSERCEAVNYAGYGIDVDFLVEVVKHASMDFEIRFVPQARLALGLHNIGMDLTSGIFYSEEDGVPRYQYQLYDIGGATAFLAHEAAVNSIQSFNDIKRVRVGAVRGEYFHDEKMHAWIRDKNNKQVFTANNYHHLFKMLEARRVDVIAVNDVVGRYILRTERWDGIKFTSFRIPYGQDPEKDGIYIAASKTLDKKIFEQLQKSTESLLQSMTLECIKSAYLMQTK